MKGIVFTEFMEHVENAHGPVIVDKMIEESAVETQGIYTSVGTYPCSELVSLIVTLSKHSGAQVPDIITQFGESLAITFKRGFPQYYDGGDYFDFVEAVEDRIHVDVLKLYPDAELPRFETVSRTDTQLVVDYMSARALEHLALGLLQGSARHFDESVEISMVVHDDSDERRVRFTIIRL